MWPFDRRRKAKEQAGAATMEVLSLLPPELVERLGGIPSAAVCGVLDRQAPESHFRANPKFVELLHSVIRKAGPGDAELQAAAALQKNGWVYVIDLRTPDGPQGRVLPEDIIGGFEVKEGVIDPQSYYQNQKHLVFSSRGLMLLPPTLQKALLEELSRLPLES